MIRTRFAPSPTGSLHVGGARTALYCLLFARRNDGRFVLRIEDTDQARSTEASRAGILRDLRWLGLLWDEGPEVGGPAEPYLQSECIDLYNQHVDALLASDQAYLAWESREELTAMRDVAVAAKENFRFKRPAYTDEQLAAYKAEGRVPVVRFQAPSHEITVNDQILGAVSQTADELEDIVIRKADGFPTYHFAVVVDDQRMGITHVLRGQEHLMNTHKHLGLMAALGWKAPAFGHMPIIFSMDGSKMSKRDKAKTARAAARAWLTAQGGPKDDMSALAATCGVDAALLGAFMAKKSDDVGVAEALAAALHVDLPMIEVMDFRKRGYLPEALINFLGLLGWSPGDDRELMTVEEMSACFSLDRVGRTPAKFDVAKLTWMNAEYIRHAAPDRLLRALAEWLEVSDSPLRDTTEAQRSALIGMYQARIDTLADLDRLATFFVQRPTSYDPKAVTKHLLKGGGLEHLAGIAAVLAELDAWDAASVDAAVAAYAERTECGLGKVAQPLRIALSGAAVTPGIGETVAFFTQQEAVARLRACLAAVAQ